MGRVGGQVAYPSASGKSDADLPWARAHCLLSLPQDSADATATRYRPR